LASHDDGATGVCNHHATLTTVYSYVLSVRDGRTQLHVLQGSPCSGADRVHLDIPFGNGVGSEEVERFLAAYPTATAANAAAAG
jgi:hypothetical protein